MNRLDAMIAPRALTSIEIAQVICPQLVAFGLAHRAFTHASVWENEDATTAAAETAVAAIAEDAERSVKEWLRDVENDGEPRFYQKAGLTRAISELCSATATKFNAQTGQSGVAVIVSCLDDRDPQTIQSIIDLAGQ